ADLAHGGQGLATDLTSMVGTTVGVAVDDLFRLHSGQSAATALAGTVNDYKLG
ncbi:MAG: hypothetical protein JO118_17235, partial [Acetobacteraceae bacterium]|nr:hypothetical protein [Acetobacteraceae bacterium]